MKLKNKIKSINFRQITCGLIFCGLVLLAAASQTPAQSKRKSVKPKTQTASVELNQNGYQPVSLRLKRGVPARITFVRRVEATCATAVVFPDYGIRRELPLNEPVVIAFTPNKTGEFTFACGMNMVRGKLIVR
jgi:Cu+-exporting ATPase